MRRLLRPAARRAARPPAEARLRDPRRPLVPRARDRGAARRSCQRARWCATLGFNPRAIDALIDRHLSGEDVGRKLFALAALERWAERLRLSLERWLQQPAAARRRAHAAPRRGARTAARAPRRARRQRRRPPGSASSADAGARNPPRRRGRATRPKRPASTSSGGAPSSVTTIGRPAAIASATTRPNPSWREVSTKTSSAAITAGMSRRAPANVTRPAEPQLARPAPPAAARMSCSTSASAAPTITKRTSGARCATRRGGAHEGLEILAGVDAADRPTRRSPSAGAQRGAHLGRSGRAARTADVDRVVEHLHLAHRAPAVRIRRPSPARCSRRDRRSRSKRRSARRTPTSADRQRVAAVVQHVRDAAAPRRQPPFQQHLHVRVDSRRGSRGRCACTARRGARAAAHG